MISALIFIAGSALALFVGMTILVWFSRDEECPCCGNDE